jgi:DNA-binding NarL/FixJ family response regulator
VNVLIADDDPHARSAVRLLLDDEPGMSIVAECASADGLGERVVSSGSDVVLVDWDLPGLRTGVELRRLWTGAPRCRIVALSGRPEQREEALRSGAVSFVCKGDPPDTLLRVLRALRQDYETAVETAAQPSNASQVARGTMTLSVPGGDTASTTPATMATHSDTSTPSRCGTPLQ